MCVCEYIYIYIPHPSSLTSHPSSLIRKLVSSAPPITSRPQTCLALIPHSSSLTPHPSSLIPHPSSLIPHSSSLGRTEHDDTKHDHILISSLFFHPSSLPHPPSTPIPHPPSPIPHPSPLSPHPSPLIRTHVSSPHPSLAPTSPARILQPHTQFPTSQAIPPAVDCHMHTREYIGVALRAERQGTLRIHLICSSTFRFRIHSNAEFEYVRIQNTLAWRRGVSAMTHFEYISNSNTFEYISISNTFECRIRVRSNTEYMGVALRAQCRGCQV